MATRTRSIRLKDNGGMVRLRACPHCARECWAGCGLCPSCGAALVPPRQRAPAARWAGLTEREFTKVNNRRHALLRLRQLRELDPTEEAEWGRVTEQCRAYADARFPLPDLAIAVRTSVAELKGTGFDTQFIEELLLGPEEAG